MTSRPGGRIGCAAGASPISRNHQPNQPNQPKESRHDPADQHRGAGRRAGQGLRQRLRPRELTLDDGTVIEIPPHPNLRMLDDDALAAWDQLWFDLEDYDHHEITLPERVVRDADGTEMVLPPETRQGRTEGALPQNRPRHRQVGVDGPAL